MAPVSEACTWSADPGCLGTPDPAYDGLLKGCRWCKRCGPLQIERKEIVQALLAKRCGPALASALKLLDDEDVSRS